MGTQNVLGVNYPYPNEGDEPWSVSNIAWTTAVSNATNTLNSSKLETVANVGAGSQLSKTKVGTAAQLRTLVAGANITLTQNANDITIAATGGGGGATWGSITGTLSDQTDLQDALDAKVPISEMTIVNATTSQTVTSVYPTFADIPGLSVTFETTRANQNVLIICQLSAISVSGTPFPFVGYTIDGGASRTMLTGGFANGYCTFSQTIPFNTLSMGFHTFNVQGATVGGSSYRLGHGSTPGDPDAEIPCAVTAVLL